MNKEIVNRLDELPRPSPEFPRRYVPNDVVLSAWENIEPIYGELLSRKLVSVEAVETWLIDFSELEAVVGEEFSRRRIAMTCATDDPDKQKAYLHYVENIIPKIKPVGNQLDRKLIDCPHAEDLDPERFAVLMRSVRNEIELFREENVPLETEIAKLTQKYQKISGAMTVTFRGRALFRSEPTASELRTAPDRGLRREALKSILTTPKNALTRQYSKLFELEGMKLTFQDEALEEMVDQAMKLDTGARALRSVIEGVMTDLMFELPDMKGIREVIITRDVVKGKSEPLYVEADVKRKSA